MKKTFTTVDLLKFFFCICIIALHTNVLCVLPKDISFYISNILCRLGVPFFFAASGFFLRKKYCSADASKHKEILFDYIKRLLFPLVFFSVIAVIQSAVTQVLDGGSTFSIIINIGQQIVFSPLGALWFIQALIVASLLMYPLLKLNHGVNVCIVIGALLYIFALLCNNYYFIVHGTSFQIIIDKYIYYCITARNGLFVGIVFMALGMKCFDIFSRADNLVKARRIIPVMLITAFALYIAEVTVLHISHFEFIDESSLYISQLPLIPAILLTAVLFSVKLPQHISVTLRNLSTGMYFLHRQILWFVLFFTDNVVLVFFFVVLISFAICMINYRFDSDHKYYLLK